MYDVKFMANTIIMKGTIKNLTYIHRVYHSVSQPSVSGTLHTL